MSFRIRDWHAIVVLVLGAATVGIVDSAIQPWQNGPLLLRLAGGAFLAIAMLLVIGACLLLEKHHTRQKLERITDLEE